MRRGGSRSWMHKYSIGIHRLLVGVALLPMRMRARMKKQINTVVTGSDHQTCIELVITKKESKDGKDCRDTFLWTTVGHFFGMEW